MYNSITLDGLQFTLTINIDYPPCLITQLEYPLGEVVPGCCSATIIQRFPVVSPDGNHFMQFFVFHYYLGKKCDKDKKVKIETLDNKRSKITKLYSLQPNDVVFSSFDEFKRAIERVKETYESLAITVENSRAAIDRALKLK